MSFSAANTYPRPRRQLRYAGTVRGASVYVVWFFFSGGGDAEDRWRWSMYEWGRRRSSGDGRQGGSVCVFKIGLWRVDDGTWNRVVEVGLCGGGQGVGKAKQWIVCTRVVLCWRWRRVFRLRVCLKSVAFKGGPPQTLKLALNSHLDVLLQINKDNR
ncbi:hypothetical protein BDU57DRAFT_349929 [Ampelomyces quisqualis]|uniref:Uncharacterized protein n=1 Tax=Ampelomyces quisqualis TaxID=50730 RepID=A0A6A5QD41_AMPQU|nr:hypothetical protein BDU57DRAFT_349929 [Ampelomyces quisqualis]